MAFVLYAIYAEDNNMIFCGGLNAYCMHIRPLFLRTSGSSGVLKALLLERNGQLSCNPKKKKKNNNMVPSFSIVINHLAVISDIQRRQLALSQSC